jgi:hypothetical protein
MKKLDVELDHNAFFLADTYDFGTAPTASRLSARKLPPGRDVRIRPDDAADFAYLITTFCY